MVQVAQTPVQSALPSYEVGGELGRGAMGVVLAGRHRQLERDVAIKQLPPAFAADEEVRHRFGQEARTLASLAHPHIVPVYDYVEREGLCLLVMEALPGGTLWDRFTGEGVTMATACTAVLATCAGLHFAHQRGVLHRDVKPENLMFAADRTLKITDFGIAQVFGGDETVTTVDGSVIGTPAYMAPEQAEGSACGPPADVYATGTVLYELLSGSLPFSIEGGSVEVLERRVHEDPVPLADVAPNVPGPLVEVTMRAIARDPDDRYGSAEAFGVALAEAATESFGSGWLGRADLTLVATGPIAIAAGPATPSTDDGVASAAGDATTVTGRETMIAGKGAPIPQDPPLRVRATAVHRAGVRIDELSPEDLVRVDDLIKPPKPPRVSLATASLLLALLVVLSVLGIGTAEPAPSALRPGTVRVGGVDITSGRRVVANLAHDVPVLVRRLPAGARDAVYVRLGFSALGLQLPPSRSAVLAPARGGGMRAAVDAQRVRVLVSGQVTGQVRFLDARKRELRSDEFRFQADRPAILTANGLVGLLVLAFVVTYGWSLSLPLRRGRRRTSAYVGMAILGGVAGAAVVDVVWSLGGPQPTWGTLLVGITLGLGAFVAVARAILVIGRRRRLVRARERKALPPDAPTSDATRPVGPASVAAAAAAPTPAARPTSVASPPGARETAVPSTPGARETAVPSTPGARETAVSWTSGAGTSTPTPPAGPPAEATEAEATAAPETRRRGWRPKRRRQSKDPDPPGSREESEAPPDDPGNPEGTSA
jgi:serine/threonine-protein kinase